MFLEENIADSIDEAMQEYLVSPEYKELQKETDCKINAFKEMLTPEQCSALNIVLDTISNEHAAFTDKAYVTGVVYGIALREEITIK